MKIAICDDDKKDIGRLNDLIKRYEQDQHDSFSTKEYVSGEDLLKDIEGGQYFDIIFLDINMDNMDGLSAAKNIRKYLGDVPIVLVTAFMNYALDGYKVRASRFLIKDDLDKTFAECMDDVCREIRCKAKIMIFSCVEGKISLKLSDIVMIETERHKNIIRLESGSYQIYEKLDELEERLKDHGFLRIHLSYLVNMQHIRNVNNYVLTLDNGKELSVPKARFKQVRHEYTLYVGKEL